MVASRDKGKGRASEHIDDGDDDIELDHDALPLSTLESLPFEVLNIILYDLPPVDLIHVAAASTTLRLAALADSIWSQHVYALIQSSPPARNPWIAPHRTPVATWLPAAYAPEVPPWPFPTQAASTSVPPPSTDPQQVSPWASSSTTLNPAGAATKDEADFNTTITPLHPDRLQHEALQASEAHLRRPSLSVFPGAESFYEVYVYFLQPVAHLLGWWVSDAPSFGGLMRFILDLAPAQGASSQQGKSRSSATGPGPSFFAQRLHLTNRLTGIDLRTHQAMPAVRVASTDPILTQPTSSSASSSSSSASRLQDPRPSAMTTMETSLWKALTSFPIPAQSYLGPPTILRYDHPTASFNVDILDPGVRTEDWVEIRWTDVRDRLRADQRAWCCRQRPRGTRDVRTGTGTEGMEQPQRSSWSAGLRSTRSAALQSTRRCWPMHPLERIRSSRANDQSHHSNSGNTLRPGQGSDGYVDYEAREFADLDDVREGAFESFSKWTIEQPAPPPRPRPTEPSTSNTARSSGPDISQLQNELPTTSRSASSSNNHVFAFDAHRHRRRRGRGAGAQHNGSSSGSSARAAGAGVIGSSGGGSSSNSSSSGTLPREQSRARVRERERAAAAAAVAAESAARRSSLSAPHQREGAAAAGVGDERLAERRASAVSSSSASALLTQGSIAAAAATAATAAAAAVQHTPFAARGTSSSGSSSSSSTTSSSAHSGSSSSRPRSIEEAHALAQQERAAAAALLFNEQGGAGTVAAAAESEMFVSGPWVPMRAITRVGVLERRRHSGSRGRKDTTRARDGKARRQDVSDDREEEEDDMLVSDSDSEQDPTHDGPGPGADKVETYEHILHRTSSAISTGFANALDARQVLLRMQRRKAIYTTARRAHRAFGSAAGYAQSVINAAGPAFGFGHNHGGADGDGPEDEEDEEDDEDGDHGGLARGLRGVGRFGHQHLPMSPAIFPPPGLLHVIRPRVGRVGLDATRAAGDVDEAGQEDRSAFSAWERDGFAMELDRLQMVPSPPYLCCPQPRRSAGPMKSGPRWYPLVSPPAQPPWSSGSASDGDRAGKDDLAEDQGRGGGQRGRLDDWNAALPGHLDPASPEYDWDSLCGLYAQSYGPHGIELVYVRSRILTEADFDAGGAEARGGGGGEDRRWMPEPSLSSDDMYVDHLIDRDAVRPGARVVEAIKVTGDPNVPRGQVTWRAFVSDPRVRRTAWRPPRAGFRNHLPWPFVESGPPRRRAGGVGLGPSASAVVSAAATAAGAGAGAGAGADAGPDGSGGANGEVEELHRPGLVTVAHGRVAGEGFAGAAWANAMVLIAPHEIRVWWQPMMKFAVARKLYGM